MDPLSEQTIVFLVINKLSVCDIRNNHTQVLTIRELQFDRIDLF